MKTTRIETTGDSNSAMRNGLAIGMASAMLAEIEMPANWRDHVAGIVSERLLNGDEGFDVPAAAAAARAELEMLSGLHGGPIFDTKLLDLVLGQYSEVRNDEDDAG